MIQKIAVKSESTLDGEIEIIYTGLRPGEKLFEELLIGEDCVTTQHTMITRATEKKLSSDELHLYLKRLKTACDKNSPAKAIEAMKAAVAEYEAAPFVTREKPIEASQNLIELSTRTVDRQAK